MTCFCAALAARATSAAEPKPTNEAEARALLAMPKSSVSLGKTSGGELFMAATLPGKGDGYRVQNLGRKTNFGTSELVGVIARATRSVAEKYPGSMLGVGNLGFASGKKIPWSVSHQAGRDADIGMYATTLDGKPLELLPFIVYGADGLADYEGRKVRFDVARNVALVTALVTDEEARVQYVFVAEWLKVLLLAEARAEKVAPAIIARLEEVLHQPTDSNPHANHFHIRLFCSIEDRLNGCINGPPTRSWVDLGDKEHAARAEALAAIFALPKDALHIQALEKLAAIHGTEALQAVLGELEHPAKKVRKAALAALVAMGDPAAASGIVAMLPRIRDAAWATALFEAVPQLDAESLVPLAVKAASQPEALLHPDVAKKAGAQIRLAGLRILRDHGAAAEVPTLLAQLGGKDKKVDAAAREALTWVTCQPPKTRFDAWWSASQRGDIVRWAREGLVARKKSVPAELRSKAGVDLLVPLVAASDAALRHCAGRALVAITGHDFDERDRTPARNKKHWDSWWHDNRASSGLP
ncbi:MAG: penicillin-insensitive murein endopeptidase [Myxococcota bacterium]